MLFVDLNDNFSCLLKSILCNFSVKGCRQNIMRKATCLICDVKLPATGVDKTIVTYVTTVL